VFVLLTAGKDPVTLLFPTAIRMTGFSFHLRWKTNQFDFLDNEFLCVLRVFAVNRYP